MLNTLIGRKMSGMDITKEFGQEYAKKLGVKYALGGNNGTAAILLQKQSYDSVFVHHNFIFYRT